MTASPSVITAADGGTGSMPDCADYWLCQQVYDWSGTDWLAENAETLIATPARILLIVVVAVLVRYLAHRAIRRLTDHTTGSPVPSILRARRLRAAAVGDGAEQVAARRTQRAEAIGSVLRSCASIVVLGIAVVLRRETAVGHGARAVSRTVSLAADQLAFLAAHTGLTG